MPILLTNYDVGADSTRHMKTMRIIRNTCMFLAVSLLATVSLSAAPREGADPFVLPQVGFWFGPVAPVYDTYGTVNTSLGVGAYARFNLPSLPLKLSAETSYQKHKSNGVNKVMLVPAYGALLYKLPFRSILSFQLKVGVGGGYVKIWPDEMSQWDPLFVFGGEFSFPAGTVANIGLRVDYLMFYEKHIPGAQRNGNFVDVGVNANFNLDFYN
jgi:hypothetical protein